MVGTVHVIDVFEEAAPRDTSLVCESAPGRGRAGAPPSGSA